MKSRLTMITRQVREVKNVEDEVRQMRRQLDNFDRYFHIYVILSVASIMLDMVVYLFTFVAHNIYRYASTGNLVSTTSMGIGPSGSPIIGGQSIMAGICIE